MHPQVVIALKGGTIKSLEADGQATDVAFPTGKAVFDFSSCLGIKIINKILNHLKDLLC